MTGNGIRFSSAEGRWVLAVTVLGSALVFLDSTVVNVALPSIGRDLDAGVSELEWVVDGYLLALAALILLGGGLGDRYGRRRVFVAGVLWFTIASVLCALAPSAQALIGARVLQGAGAAARHAGQSRDHPHDLRDGRARAGDRPLVGAVGSRRRARTARRGISRRRRLLACRVPDQRATRAGRRGRVAALPRRSRSRP